MHVTNIFIFNKCCLCNSKLYNFKNAIDYEKSFSQWVSSMQPNAFILTRICPWIYAKLYNMKNRKKKQSEFNTYDFIDKELLLK